mmetsp:Transcript_5324/g.9581  ORF Transcript_5324/g.9581 Transcript_5324/m.9581 type:complete len:267 (+) Transcript_5324:142-942(+)
MVLSLGAWACRGTALKTSLMPQIGVLGATRGFTQLSLSNLRPNPLSKKAPKRLGRGPGSGLGKTSGRGMKGQKARSGNKGLKARGFEGGQTPFHIRVPKWGFTNKKFKKNLEELSLMRILKSIAAGNIDPSKTITMKTLFDAHIVGKVKYGVKVINGKSIELKVPIHLEVTRASKSVIAAVEAAGGTVVAKYHNRLGLRALLKPNKFGHPDLIPKQARPTKKRDLEYYTNYENRGYLAPEMQLKMLERNRALEANTAAPSQETVST